MTPNTVIKIPASLEDFGTEEEQGPEVSKAHITAVSTVETDKAGRKTLVYKVPLSVHANDLRLWRENPADGKKGTAKGMVVALVEIPEGTELSVTRTDGSVVGYMLKRGGTRCVNLGFDPAPKGGPRVISKDKAKLAVVKEPLPA